MHNRRKLMFSIGPVAKTNGVIDGVIQDSIEQIIINCQADKAKEFYAVGDHVPLTLEGIGTFDFDYLGSGLDVRTDGSNKPVSAWLCRTVPTTCMWNTSDTTSGGWGSSNIRNYCRTTIYNALPKEIRDNIVEVNKVSNGVTTSDTVWLPSYEEMNNGAYKARFPDANSRKKTGAGVIWWLRSFDNSRFAYCVGSGGFIAGYNASSACGVVPGFCL